MPIDIENLNPSTKFPYPLPEDGDQIPGKEEWVRVRILSAEQNREIEEKTSTLKSEFVQPRKPNGKINTQAPLQRVEYRQVTNQDLRDEMIWDGGVDEIHLYDKTGDLLPSTKEMKCKLMGESPVFALYVASCLEILTEDEKEQAEARAKNSTSSPSE